MIYTLEVFGIFWDDKLSSGPITEPVYDSVERWCHIRDFFGNLQKKILFLRSVFFPRVLLMYK